MARDGNPWSGAADYAAQVGKLAAVAEALGRCPAQVAVLEEAARIADSHNDEELAYEVRMELIDAATFGACPDVSLVAFAWCLAKSDQEPERFDGSRLLWKYKWVLEAVLDYPQFGREQLEAMLADMERRYSAAGSGLHPVHQTAREVYRLLGDLPEAAAAHERTMRCEEDRLSNCRACEQHAQVKFLLDSDRPADALRTAGPIVSGRMKCAEIPHATYSYLLIPLVAAGQPKVAADYHRKGLALIGTNPKFLSQAARHVLFLAFTDNLTAAARLFERHLPNAAATTCPAWRFDFLRTAVFLFDRIADAHSQPPAAQSVWSAALGWLTGGASKPPRVRFPANFALPDDLDRSDPAALRDHFASEARELARAFDARGTSARFARQLDELAELKDRVAPYLI